MVQLGRPCGQAVLSKQLLLAALAIIRHLQGSCHPQQKLPAIDVSQGQRCTPSSPGPLLLLTWLLPPPPPPAGR